MCILCFPFLIFYFETFMLELFISNQQPVCSFRGPFCLLAHFSLLNSSIPLSFPILVSNHFTTNIKNEWGVQRWGIYLR